MKGENKVITAEFVHEAIDKVADRFDKNGLIRRNYCEIINEDGSSEVIDFLIEEEIEMLLDGLNVVNKVALIEAFASVHLDIWILGVSFVINGELHQHFIKVQEF